MAEIGKEGPHFDYGPPREGGGQRGAEREDVLQEHMLREGHINVETGLEKVADTLKKIEALQKEEGKDKELEAIKERMRRQYESLMDAQFSRTEEILDGGLLRFQNPYPYDSRYGAMWFDNLERGIEDVRNREWAGETTKAWLKRIEIDAAWGKANFKLLEMAGPLMTAYYDGKRMMQWLRQMRSMVTADDYQRAFSKEVPGLKIDEEQKKLLSEEAREGVRERAVEFQDENMYWRIALASAAQWDYASPPTEKGDLYDLSPAELDFINVLFRQDYELSELGRNEDGEVEFDDSYWIWHEDRPDRKFPSNGLLNWGTMKGSAENKKRYFALMESLLLEDASDELQKMYKEQPNGEKSYNKKDLLELALKVEKRAESLLEEGTVKESEDLETRLAGIVVRSGIVSDWGHMSSPDLGWAWKYKEYEEADDPDPLDVSRVKFKGQGGEVYVREGGTGSLYSAMDITTPVFWSEHTISYDEKARTRTQLFPPTSSEFRKEVDIEKPGWEKDIAPYLKNDPTLRDAFLLVGISFDDVPHSNRRLETLRDRHFNGGLSEDVAKALKSMAWAWETPIEHSDSGEREERRIVMPIFLPPKLNTINFWKAVPAWKQEKDKLSDHTWENNYRELKNLPSDWPSKLIPPRNTVWEEFVENRKPLSEVEWQYLAELPLDGWQVSILQMEMWLRMALDQVGEDEAKMFFSDRSGQSDPSKLKEFIKRVELGTRDEKVTYMGEEEGPDGEIVEVEKAVDNAAFELAIIPMFVAFWTANEHGIIGMDPKRSSKIDMWKEDLGKWMREMEELPSKKGGVKNYNYSMSAMTLFYALLLERAGEVARENMRSKLGNIKSAKINEAFDNTSK